MKKAGFVFLLILVSVFAFQCRTQKEAHYIVPEQYTGETRENMVKMLEQGQKLYRIHCSPCHGIFGNGKDSIPNFSKTQVEAYSAAALRQDPDNHAVVNKVRPYDLDMIVLFLSFRKPPSIVDSTTSR